MQFNEGGQAAEPAAVADVSRLLKLDPHALRTAAIEEAHKRIKELLGEHFSEFTAQQQEKIRALLGIRGAKRVKVADDQAPPRYWLPFNGDTWSGKGRPPRSFLAWEGTVAHAEWKRRHPDERFPRYPG